MLPFYLKILLHPVDANALVIAEYFVAADLHLIVGVNARAMDWAAFSPSKQRIPVAFTRLIATTNAITKPSFIANDVHNAS